MIGSFPIPQQQLYLKSSLVIKYINIVIVYTHAQRKADIHVYFEIKNQEFNLESDFHNRIWK